MTSQELFVTTLRQHRQRSRLSLEEISIGTRVKIELFEGLERGDLSEWPRGLYARAWVRAYATAIGLDPSETVDEFCRLFPQADRRSRSLEHRADAQLVYELRRPAWRTSLAESTRAVREWLSRILSPPRRGRGAPRASS